MTPDQPGSPVRPGAQARPWGAVAELNARGGILGKPIELMYYDDQSRPDQAVQGVVKLVDQSHVPIILGAFSSENTRA